MSRNIHARYSRRRLAVAIAGAVVAFGALAASPARAQLPRSYSVTHLGTLRQNGDGNSTATALNEEGVVVGISDGDNQNRLAFRWEPGSGIYDLRQTGIFLGGLHSGAFGINNAGQIVGEVNTMGNPFEFSHAFFHGPGLYDLNGLGTFLGGQNSRTTAVNQAGTAAGWAQRNGGAIFPFRWSASGGIEALFAPGAVGGKAHAINNMQWAAGSLDLPGTTVAAVWAPPGGGVTLIRFTNAPVQEAFGMNDNNVVVGAARFRRRLAREQWRAFIADLNTQRVRTLRQPAGAQQSWAYDINNQGLIVGSAGREAPITLNATLWVGNRAINLNTRIPRNSGWRLTRAFAINEAGQIVGEGIFQGNTRAFLLTPQP